VKPSWERSCRFAAGSHPDRVDLLCIHADRFDRASHVCSMRRLVDGEMATALLARHTSTTSAARALYSAKLEQLDSVRRH
jgi:hypothetical protein